LKSKRKRVGKGEVKKLSSFLEGKSQFQIFWEKDQMGNFKKKKHRSQTSLGVWQKEKSGWRWAGERGSLHPRGFVDWGKKRQAY